MPDSPDEYAATRELGEIIAELSNWGNGDTLSDLGIYSDTIDGCGLTPIRRPE